jgi:ATP-binding cassette, subfamily F, member 3
MDRLWLVADGGVKIFEGDVEEYRRLVLGERGARGDAASRNESAARASVANAPTEPAGSSKEQRRAAAERRQQLAPLRNQAKTLEKELARLTAEREALEKELANPALYANAAKAATLAKKRGELSLAIARAEERWLAVAEEIQTAESLAS